jgi:hypothetical protein
MSESLFTSQTPVVADASDGAPGITMGTSLIFADDGEITHVRFYATATVSGTYTALVYEVTGNDEGAGGTGTLLASKVAGVAPTPGAWNTIELDTPVPVVTTELYRVAVHNTAGRYVATNSLFASPIVNGNITGPQNGADPVGLGSMAQGTFTIDAAPSYPRQVGTAAAYFIDVVYAAEGALVPVTPKSWTLPFVVRAAVTPKSWTLPFLVRQAVSKSFVLRWVVEADAQAGLAGARSEIRAALATITGLTAFAERPSVIALGSAWPMWRGLTRSHGGTGLLISTWHAFIVVGKTERAATDFVDARAQDVAIALQPAGWVTAVEPYLIDTEAGPLYAVQITLTRE